MGRRRAPCDRTFDLLAWLEAQQPAVEIQRYDERRVRAVTMRGRIARAVSETLRDCGVARAEIAERMSQWLGEEVSINMLNAYASEAREDHTIPFLRLLALVDATGDERLLQIGAEAVGQLVVSKDAVAWLNDAADEARVQKVERMAKLLRSDRRQRQTRQAASNDAEIHQIIDKMRAA